MPNFIDYHLSVTFELDAVKNRIRNLVTHWPTDGEWKEAALRTLLRARLPGGTLVGRGFIVGRTQSSTQIDLLVLRNGKPTLFRDGDLAIVTPDVPHAIVEVKTNVEGAAAWYEVAKKLAEHGKFCKEVANNEPWLGIFVYEGQGVQSRNIIEAIARVYKEVGITINCVTCGYSMFARYWPAGEAEPGDDDVNGQAAKKRFRIYELENLSPAYFTSNLVDAICNVDRRGTDYAWFAHTGGKKPHMIDETLL